MSMNNICSPVSGNANTTLTDIFLSRDIIKLYQNQLGIDVSRYFTGKESFSLYRCNDTGYRFYYPRGMDGDGEFYACLQKSLGDDYYHEWKFEYQLALELLQPFDKVLDIGCGIGKFLRRAKDRAAEVVGLELNEQAVNYCKQNGLTVYNELIEEHAKKKESYYDVVCFFQVLEHINDVRPFLENALKVLKRNGKLVIGVPNNEPYFWGYDKYCTLNLPPHHMGLWNRDVFVKTAPLFHLRMLDTVYDIKGSIRIEAYLRAKFMALIKTPAGKHSLGEKIKILAMGLITVPLTIYKKFTKGLHGSHIAVVFEKL